MAYHLPTVWPEVSMMGLTIYARLLDFHHLRKKCDVRIMWGDLDPQWRLLQSQLEARDLAGILALRLMHLWGDGRRESRVRTMPWLGSQCSMAPCWGHWCKARLWWPDDRSGLAFHLLTQWWPCGPQGVSPCGSALAGTCCEDHTPRWWLPFHWQNPCLTLNHSWTRGCLDRFCSSTSASLATVTPLTWEGLSGDSTDVYIIRAWPQIKICSKYSLASLHGCFTCRGSRQVIFNTILASRISGVLTDVTDMSSGMHGFFLHRKGMHGFFLHWYWPWFKECYFCLGDSHYARRGNGGPQDPNEWKYGILRAAEEVVRAGVLS